MVDSEGMLQILGKPREEGISGMAARHEEMCCQRRFGGAERPYVKIVHVRNAGLTAQIAAVRAGPSRPPRSNAP